MPFSKKHLRDFYGSGAFSLVEIVLAIGIIAFAIVAIMGMFPVALKSAQESQRQTRATLIAQQIFTDISSVGGTNRILCVGTNNVPLSLATSGSLSLGYDEYGSLLGVLPVTNAQYQADVVVKPDVLMPGLTQVQAVVYTPAGVPATSPGRSTYNFVTSFSRN